MSEQTKPTERLRLTEGVSLPALRQMRQGLRFKGDRSNQTDLLERVHNPLVPEEHLVRDVIALGEAQPAGSDADGPEVQAAGVAVREPARDACGIAGGRGAEDGRGAGAGGGRSRAGGVVAEAGAA